MTSKTPEIDDRAISLPITSEICHIAEEFATRQPNSQKAERVRLNTIAVSVVNNYLEMLGIQTDLSASDSWNPVMQLCSDSADLAISGVGKLECRTVKTGADSCQIPLEVWDLRIGYVVVEIEDSGKEAKILGFIDRVATEELPLNTLQPLEYLIDRIYDLKESTADSSLVNLGNWFDSVFDAGWQTVESLFSPQQLIPALGFRNANASDGEPFDLSADMGVTRAKEIDLGVQLGDRGVILLIRLIPEANDRIGITLQVHPQPDKLYLPEALTLKILENSEEFMEAQARSQDNFIQLQFSGQTGERFTVEIVLNEARFSEHFRL